MSHSAYGTSTSAYIQATGYWYWINIFLLQALSNDPPEDSELAMTDIDSIGANENHGGRHKKRCIRTVLDVFVSCNSMYCISIVSSNFHAVVLLRLFES